VSPYTEGADYLTGQDSLPEAAADSGEKVVDAFTGGNAREWRQDFYDQEGDLGEVAAETRQEIAEGGLFNNVRAANEAARVGIDAMIDNPQGPNLQDAGRSAGRALTGAESDAELAGDIEAGNEAVDDFFAPLGDAYMSGVEAVGLGDNPVATGATNLPEWLFFDPAEAAVTAATGVDPDSGKQEQRAEPIDLAEAATLGTSKALSVGARGARAGARALTKSDDVAGAAARTADDAPSASPPGGAVQSAGIGGAIASGVSRLTDMGKFSWIDDAASALSRGGRGSSSGGSGLDDVAGGIDESTGSLGGIDEFDSLSRSIGTSDNLRFSSDLGGSSFPTGGVRAGAGLGGEATSINRLADDLSATFDEFASPGARTIGESGSRSVDDIGTPLSSTFDDVFSRTVDDTGSAGAARAAGASARAADDAATSATDDVFGIADEPLSASDDAGRATDQAAWARADDAAARGGDEAASAADDAATGITGRIRSWWDDLKWRYKYGVPGVIGGALIAGELLGGVDDSADGRRDPGPQGQERYRAEQVKKYDPAGVLYEIQQGSDGTEWKTAGYAIYLGKDKEGRWVSAGSHVVLSKQARPVQMQPVEGKGGEGVPKPRFGSVSEADQAYRAFIENMRKQQQERQQQRQQQQQQQQQRKGPQQAEGVEGELNAPSEVNQGESFDASWSATLKGEAKQMSARLTLAIPSGDSLVPLAEDDFSLGGGRSEDSGQFSVQSGWSSVSPGDYSLTAVIVQNGEPIGALAKTDITVNPADQGDKSQEGSSWGDPEVVRELPGGWYLCAQAKEDGIGETRFMVAGKRDDGTRIYLNPEGKAQESPHFYPTVEKAAAAFRQWLNRKQNGNTSEGGTPSQGADRPSPSDVKKDAAGSDKNTAQGILNRATRAIRNNPILFAGGTAATLAVAYYLYNEGYFDTSSLPEVDLR